MLQPGGRIRVYVHLSMGFFNLFSLFFFPFSVVRRATALSRRPANTQLRLNTGVTEPQRRGENEENGTFRDDTANRTAS
jgi:hypothetical protein